MKKILIINMCNEKLSKDEFIRPIINAIKCSSKKMEVLITIKHHTTFIQNDIDEATHIIISGTALINNEFLNSVDRFDWLQKIDKPILGICAGMETIAKTYDVNLLRTIDSKEIGMHPIKKVKNNNTPNNSKIIDSNMILPKADVFESYCLHGNAIDPKDKMLDRSFFVLAKSVNCIQAIKHKTKPIYGLQFHPEVRNIDIIERFLNI